MDLANDTALLAIGAAIMKVGELIYNKITNASKEDAAVLTDEQARQLTEIHIATNTMHAQLKDVPTQVFKMGVIVDVLRETMQKQTEILAAVQLTNQFIAETLKAVAHDVRS